MGSRKRRISLARTLAPAMAIGPLSLLLSVVGAATPSYGEAVRQDWLDKDVSNIRLIKGLIPVMDGPVADFITMLGETHMTNDRDIGFGGRRLSVAKYGGYMTCWLEVLDFHGYVAQLEGACDTSRDGWEHIKETIQQAWGNGAALVEDGTRFGIKYSFAASDRLSQFRDAVAGELGTFTSSELSVELRGAYEMLTSPLTKMDVGHVCYEGGVPPPGRKEINQLVELKRVDLIRNVLRGPNPEGRIYAAEALIILAQRGTPLDAADEVTIRKIRALEIPISSCGGCVVMQITDVDSLLPK